MKILNNNQPLSEAVYVFRSTVFTSTLISKILSITLGTLLLISTSLSYAEQTNLNKDSNINTAMGSKAVSTIATKTDSTFVPLNLHSTWQILLQKHIKKINNGNSTAVDYAGIKQQQTLLQYYLKQLGQVSRIEFDAWTKSKQLAFLINAYNAWTVEFILSEYPDLDSIKDLGSFFNSPWDKKFIPLLDQKLSLNNIEHDLIRGSGRYNDPRIHFAVNCASIGCPALLEEAYTEDKLEQQLTQQTQRFLTDKSRNYIKGNTLYLSSIFKWYGDDFEVGFRGSKSIQAFILHYSTALKLTDAQQSSLKKQDFDIDFLDYNWKLNDTHG